MLCLFSIHVFPSWNSVDIMGIRRSTLFPFPAMSLRKLVGNQVRLLCVLQYFVTNPRGSTNTSPRDTPLGNDPCHMYINLSSLQ